MPGLKSSSLNLGSSAFTTEPQLEVEANLWVIMVKEQFTEKK